MNAVDSVAIPGRGRLSLRLAIRLTSYGAASLMGAVAVGLLAVAVGTIVRGLPADLGFIPAALMIFLGGTSALDWPATNVISSRWRVPASWGSRFGATTFSVIFGFSLGTGILTKLPSMAFVALLVWCAAGGSMLSTATVMSVFGMVRAAPVIALSLSSRTWREVHSGLKEWTAQHKYVRLGEGLIAISLGVIVFLRP